jgi:hypothetical protein
VEQRVTSYIPRLARIAGRSRSGAKRKAAVARPAAGSGAAAPHVNIEYLAGLVPVIRRRLAIAATFSDEAIFASLTTITAPSTYEGRWQAAEASTLGQFLLSHGKDLKACLITILALLPKPYL